MTTITALRLTVQIDVDRNDKTENRRLTLYDGLTTMDMDLPGDN